MDRGPVRTQAEGERQLATLHRLDYPALAGLTPAELDALVRPVLARVRERLGDELPDDGGIPFLLVVTSALVPTVGAVERWSVRGRSGWTDMAAELPDYRPVDGLDVPADPVYALLDVDTGAGTLGVTPQDALPTIVGAGRQPLTIDEGVALVTHFSDVFDSRNAFQALGSRAPNRRVPSFWFSKGAPRLGWCWAGNPHSWLGAASTGGRLAAS